MSAAIRPTLLAAAAGVSLALALPGPGLVPLVLLVPGLFGRALGSSRGWGAFRCGWIAGTAQWLVAVAWVVIVLHRYGHLALPLAILGLLVMAGILGLGWALVAWGVGRVPGIWRVGLLPLALAAFEQVQHLPPWIFPWNPAAAVATAWPPLMAPLPVLGTAGLSLVIYLAGSGLDALLDRSRRAAGALALLAASAGFLVGAIAAPPFHPTGARERVAALQPNVPLEYRWDGNNLAAIQGRVEGLTAAAASAGARWVVWPESAVPRIVERDGAYRAGIEGLARAHGIWVTVGSIGEGPGDEDYANSVFQVSPGGVIPWRYDKVHLVPFGEYVPLAGQIGLLRPLVREVGSFTPGRSVLPLPSPVGPAGIAVCYEVAFPSLYAAEVRHGAEVLVTVTNDGWYGDSAAPRQHLALARLRAAENRRFLVRAANTGISAIIDPTGRLVTSLEFGREGIVAGEVYGGTGLTPAVRWGWLVAAGMPLCAVGAILIGTRRRESNPR